MKAVIPGLNIKGVSFRTVNSARSAFASFLFYTSFFSHYEEGASVLGSDGETVKCKVSLKACANVFKFVNSVDKTVEKCKITLDAEDAKLVMHLTCRHGIIKTYNIPFIECEMLQAEYDTDDSNFRLKSQSRLLSEAVLHFQLNQDEITLTTSPEKTVVRNYVDDEPDPSKAIHTELTLESSEFDQCVVDQTTEVTFCLKELRALLSFSEPVSVPVEVYFSTPGSPIIFHINNKPMFEASFVLATLASQLASQASSVRTVPQAVAAKAKQNARLETDQDRDSEEDVSVLSDVPPNERNSDELFRRSRGPDRSHRSKYATDPVGDGCNSSPSAQECANGNGQICAESLSRGVKRKRNFLDSEKKSSAAEHYERETNGAQRTRGKDLHKVSEDESMDSLVAIHGNDVGVDRADIIQGTPPAKRKSFLFKRCFESTFNPDSIPGWNNILAMDSDSE